VDGKNPRVVAKEIEARMGVSQARAEGYAQTDITDTLRMARLDERDWAVENLGMDIGLLWKSALIPTTRPWHASRNGQVYTSAEVRQFYAGPDRYRCHCSVTEVLLDDDGKALLTDRARQTSVDEIKAWEKKRGAAKQPAR